MTHGKTKLFLAGWAVIATMIACGVAFWALTQSRADQRKSPPTPAQDNPSQRASLDYWNQLIALDSEQLREFEKLFRGLQAAETEEQQIEYLVQVAAGIKPLVEDGERRTARFPVLWVDDELLKFVREELRLNREMSDHLSGMAQSTIALVEWKQRRNDLPPTFWGDLFDSAIQGLMGRPFAGWEKAKADVAILDEEGGQLVQSYAYHQQGFLAGVKRQEQAELEELELRSRLSSKYGVEFPPRPKLSAGNQP